MKAFRPALATLLFCVPLIASGQWLWVDKDGKKVYSDRPPPSDIAADRILKQPGARNKSVSTAPAPAPTATAAAPAGLQVQPPTGKDKALDEKRKQAEAAEADKRKAEEAKVAAVKADNCSRSKASKASFDSGMRISQTNAKGEREILDDKQRATEVKRLEAVIARDC